jgi:hypothetical protein
MNSPFTLYTIVVLVAAALAAIAIWAPRSLPLKISALVLAAALMATGYVGFMEIIGRPKPVSAEWALETIEDAAVVATRLREGEGIYLWLEGRGAQEPRAYVLAWDLGDAKQLQQTAPAGHATGRGARHGRAHADNARDQAGVRRATFLCGAAIRPTAEGGLGPVDPRYNSCRQTCVSGVALGDGR